MSLFRDDSQSDVFFNENKSEDDYDFISMSGCVSNNGSESLERTNFDSCDKDKNTFDCLSFMDFSSSEEKTYDGSHSTMKSLFHSEPNKAPKKIFMTFKREKKCKLPSMICDYEGCGMAFRHLWIFQKHLSSHSTCKFFRCPEPGCRKLYKSKENLNLHTKNIHEGIKPYQCRFCSDRFSHRNGKLKFKDRKNLS